MAHSIIQRFIVWYLKSIQWTFYSRELDCYVTIIAREEWYRLCESKETDDRERTWFDKEEGQ